MKYRGSLSIMPRSALLTRDTEIGKMDPYLIINIGSRKFKSKVQNNEGSKPTWDETFVTDIEDLNDFHISVYDDDWGKDDFICETRIPLANVIAKGHVSQQFPLYYKGAPSGHINIDMNFKMSY